MEKPITSVKREERIEAYSQEFIKALHDGGKCYNIQINKPDAIRAVVFILEEFRIGNIKGKYKIMYDETYGTDLILYIETSCLFFSQSASMKNLFSEVTNFNIVTTENGTLKITFIFENAVMTNNIK